MCDYPRSRRHDGWVADAPGVHQPQEYLAAVGMHGIGHRLPRCTCSSENRPGMRAQPISFEDGDEMTAAGPIESINFSRRNWPESSQSRLANLKERQRNSDQA